MVGKIRLLNRYKTNQEFEYIGRGTAFGNPFILKDNTDSERDRVCDEYQEHFDKKIQDKTSLLYIETHKLIRRVQAGETVNIACSCKPKRCHGDTIINYIRERAMKPDTEPKQKTIICVNGGRDVGDYMTETEFRRKLIDTLVGLGFDDTDSFSILHGGAPGADTYAGRFAEAAGIEYHIREAQWDDITHPRAVIKTNQAGKQYNAIAGHQRNSVMVTESDMLISFWNGVSPGTKDMINKMKAVRKPTHIIKY